MIARKMLQAESGWEKAETRLKTWIYTLAHELLQNQITSSILYKLLLFIEMLQFLWYAVHPNFDFLWDVDVSTWLREAIKYFQLDAVLNEDMQSIFVVCLYLVFGIQMLMLLTAVATTYKLTRSKKKTSTIVTYSLKALSGYSMLMTTFFALPIFNVYFASIICYDDDFVHGNLECYSGIYFLHLVIGIIGLVLHLVVMFYLNYLYIDLNPWSAIPFASPQSKINFIRLALKIALALYIILDYSKGFTKEFIAIYGIIWIFILIFRYRQTPFYNRSIFRFALGMDSIVLWACIVANVHAFVNRNVDDLGLFYLFFGFPIFAYAFITITERRKIVYRRVIIKNLKKDTDVEMYINVIFHLIQNRDKPQHRMALEGLLKYHVKHCMKKEGECACYSLSRDYVKDDEPPEKLWYTWIKHIIVDVLERFPKSTRLHMLYAYIQREKLQNKFKALFEMMITEENKPNVEEDFSIFSYKNVIEEEMIENDARNSESKGVDVNIIVDFQNKFVDFQAAVENAVDLHLEFWRELLENNPDIQKLQSLGSKITHSFEETSAEFRKLNEINPNHIKMLQIYGNYLKDVMNDEVEGQRTLEKADYVEKSAAVNKQFIDNDHLKYGENSNTCILTISGNLTSIGIIKNVNNEITRILGFSKQDLIGQNVSRIIPKIIGDLHDGFMKNYFETSEPRVIGHERLVYPLNKEGYIVPCSLMIKVLPNLDEGIRLVGFLKDVDKDGSFAKGSDFETEEKVHHIMYSGDTGAIHGITHSCKRGFGIPASLVSGANANNDFTMDIIFPDLLSHTLEDLKAAAGIVTALDTSSLQQNYLLGDSESDKSDYGENEEEEKEKRFRKTNVRVGLAEDTDYQDVNIKVLRFVEVYEDGDIRRQTSANREADEKPQDQTAKPEDESKVEVIDPNRSAEYERSEKESSVSGGEAINEDIKQLKDFKALISEKTVPKSIKLLSRAVFLLLLLLITFASLILKFRLDQTSDFGTGITAIRQAYKRTDLMASINYNIRKLERLARYQLEIPYGKTYDQYQYDIKGHLITLIDSLSTVQFDIMRATEVLKSKGANTIDSQSFTLEHLVDSTTTRTEDRIYTDSVFQYITAASSIRNSTISNIILVSTTDSTPKNFYFVRRNGLGPLREGSEAEALNFYNFYLDTADDYNTKFQIIMIVAIIVIALSDMILIPIVFSVHKTNDRVLAFFGYIPISEITELAAKCERYVQNYIEDHKQVRGYSFDGSEEEQEHLPHSQRTENENSYLESQGNQEEEVVEGDSINPDTSMQLDVSEKIEVSPIQNFRQTPKQATLNVPANSGKRVNTGGKSGREMTSGEHTALKTKQDMMMLSSQDNSKVALNKNQSGINRDDVKRQTMKDDEKKKEEAENDEAANDRSQKLLNSRNNRRASVVIQFVAIAAIFGIYFLIDFVVIESNFLSNIRQTLLHLQLTSERMPMIRYLQAFTLEEIAENQSYAMYNYSNVYTNFRDGYESQIQSNEQTIQDPSRLDFPADFDNYLDTFKDYNDGDLCATYYASLGKQAQCQLVSDGILTRGLTLAITTITLNSDDILKQFASNWAAASTSAAQNASQISAIQSTKFNKSDAIVNKTMPAFSKLLDDYIVAYNDYLDQSDRTEGIKFAVFIIFCFLVFFALWQPYLKNLKDKIFRTKGMLNMIPMDIISKNENLRTQFLSGNILQAVK